MFVLCHFSKNPKHAEIIELPSSFDFNFSLFLCVTRKVFALCTARDTVCFQRTAAHRQTCWLLLISQQTRGYMGLHKSDRFTKTADIGQKNLSLLQSGYCSNYNVNVVLISSILTVQPQLYVQHAVSSGDPKHFSRHEHTK